jgi:hypothetical protein
MLPPKSILADRDTKFLLALTELALQAFLLLQRMMPQLWVVALAYRANPSSGVPQIYTLETCQEVHLLLTTLLNFYEESLQTLYNLQKMSVSLDSASDHEIAILRVTMCTMTLRALMYSSFVEEHIIHIQPPDPHTIQVQGKGADAEPGDDEEEDPELLNIGICGEADHVMVAWSYLAFLRLQVGPFEAADTLLGATSRVVGNRQITILTIATAFPSETLRDWEEVVEEIMALPSTDPTPCSIKQATEVIRGVLKACKITGKLKFKGTTHCEATLALLIWGGYLPVSSIAIDIWYHSNTYGIVQDVGKIIGVSKRSCPVCSYLFVLLGEEYCISRSHRIVSGCSLPSTIPGDLMDEMISEFGGWLKTVILHLHGIDPNKQKKTFTEVTSQNQQRTISVQSQPFSVSSNEGSDSGSLYYRWLHVKLAGRGPEIWLWLTSV